MVGRGSKGICLPNLWADEKLWKKKFLVEKISSKNAKVRLNTPIL